GRGAADPRAPRSRGPRDRRAAREAAQGLDAARPQRGDEPGSLSRDPRQPGQPARAAAPRPEQGPARRRRWRHHVRIAAEQNMTSLSSVAVIAAVALVAPLSVGLTGLRLPAIVVEILLGIAIGPQALGWATVDEPVAVLSTIGLAFLLFL